MFFSAVCERTAKHNILGAAQAKDNNNDKIIALAPPTLKNNRFWEDTASNGGVGKGCEETEERPGWRGRSIMKPILLTKPVGVGRNNNN